MSEVKNNMADDIVLFEELICKNGTRVGVATLNTPKTLNGLSLDMTRLLAARMELWAADPDLALVVLRGAGEKAFCAGGDLHTLHHSILQDQGKLPSPHSYPGTFFAEEYTLDYRIHTFPKPIMVWGDGIVMGGGMGLMMGASHRVVTDTTRMAMPEISIGLFPDVGGTWMLNRLPGKTGLFLGLTGAMVGAADALFAGMADYHVPRAAWTQLLDRLTGQPWVRIPNKSGLASANEAAEQHAHRVINDDYLNGVLNSLSTHPEPAIGPLQQHQSLIQKLCNGADLNKIVANILALSEHTDPWLQRAAKTLAAGSPGSARLTFTLLQRTRHVSLAEVYRIEWVAGLACTLHGDFAEGIRALLIDKDKQPRWNPASLSEATPAWVEKFFTLPFPANEHPLRSLGASA